MQSLSCVLSSGKEKQLFSMFFPFTVSVSFAPYLNFLYQGTLKEQYIFLQKNWSAWY